ncbi:MAG: U32 family peptidase [Pseudoflavonifractor sp.]|nr:U32 family peptidase [Alloprevotella sp.]MCM1116698.1 U32 family peptidase [Pseudoflavonifractor sp.]
MNTPSNPSLPIELELLAPARNKATALAALYAGADAIYIGAPSHGARAAAACSIDDIRSVARAAHALRARVYVALNTLVYDDELEAVNQMIWNLYHAGADALIIQDIGITELRLPPIALHASTQTDIRGIERAREMASLGMTRIVVARELSLRETEAIHQALPHVEIEAFVHGALCVCFSGDCRASFAATSRSANRGECSQMCRHAYTLRDSRGSILAGPAHLLSLRDLNRSSRLAEMAHAGVTSFKIEGRLKDEAYVLETVGYYSRLLNRLVECSEGRYCRASIGNVALSFTPDPTKAFNRGFTQYFTTGVPPKGLPLKMASLDSPAAAGSEVGSVTAVIPKGGIKVRLNEGVTVAAGDGLSYTSSDGAINGFRVNRVERNMIFLPPGVKAPQKGATLRRTLDAARQRLLSRPDAAVRSIPIDITLRLTPSGRVAAEAVDPMRKLCVAVATSDIFADKAASIQAGQRRRPFEKLGDTGLSLNSFTDNIDPELFIPASALTSLRRSLISTLAHAAAATYRFPAPGTRDANPIITGANIANHLARRLAPTADEAAETLHPSGRGMEGEQVMTTRYCIRRELGRCLSTEAGRQWQGPLTIYDDAGNSFRLDFDCKQCLMHLFWLGRKRTTCAAPAKQKP